MFYLKNKVHDIVDYPVINLIFKVIPFECAGLKSSTKRLDNNPYIVTPIRKQKLRFDY